MVSVSRKVVLTAIVSLSSAGPVLPEFSYAVATHPRAERQLERLDYLIVDVNGAARLVKCGAEVRVVRGDKVIIRSASLINSAKNPTYVNVIGYPSKNSKNSVDDRGQEIDTGKDLLSRWSKDKKGLSYEIKVLSHDQLHGAITLTIIDPQLRYAVLKVNGKTSILREGQVLRVNKADDIKVDQVVTNLEEIDDDVTFQIVPVKMEPPTPGVNFYEVRFLRDEAIFARIPLQVEGA